MENKSNESERKYRRTPVDDPSILDTWRSLYERYTKINELSKTAALERIAREYSTSRSTVEYHLFPKIRSKRLETKKGKTPHKNTPEYRLRNAAIQHVHKNIHFYIQKTFEKADYQTLSIDDIRYSIKDILIESDRPPVIIRGSTLVKLVKYYETSTGKKFLEKVSYEQSVLYRLILKETYKTY